MKPADRLKVYSAMAEVSRKWCTVMDTKAGFVSALNAALLAFLWSGGRFGDETCWPLWAALLSTGLSAASLWIAVLTAIPTESLKASLKRNVTYKDGYKPVSFYAYVAVNYQDSQARFERDVWALGEDDLAREALEQHYAISHVARQKSKKVAAAALVWVVALLAAAAALTLKRLTYGC